jgi:hypothetical protein
MVPVTQPAYISAALRNVSVRSAIKTMSEMLKYVGSCLSNHSWLKSLPITLPFSQASFLAIKQLLPAPLPPFYNNKYLVRHQLEKYILSSVPSLSPHLKPF